MRIVALCAFCLAALSLAGCGSPRTAVDRRAALDEAIAEYFRGDLARAEILLLEIVGSDAPDEDQATAYLYLGRLYLDRSDYQRAADALSSGKALVGGTRFDEYFNEAQRRLVSAGDRIFQLPRVTRAQLAAVIEERFAPKLTPACNVRSEVMRALPDGDFHANDPVTSSAFYSILWRLSDLLGLDRRAMVDLYPRGFRSTLGGGAESYSGEGDGIYISGAQVRRALDTLDAAAVSAGG